MQRIRKAAPSGFTLLELMLVIAVIGILMAMLVASAYSARQRAYASTATAEVQQIATAFKSYYLAHHKWPNGSWDSTPLNKQNLAPLIGGEGIVYLDLSDFRLEGDEFLDPWGNPYRVSTERVDTPSIDDTFEGAVSFPNHFRHYFEEGVYDRTADDWKDLWDPYN